LNNIFHPTFLDPTLDTTNPANFGVVTTQLIPANRNTGSRSDSIRLECGVLIREISPSAVKFGALYFVITHDRRRILQARPVRLKMTQNYASLAQRLDRCFSSVSRMRLALS